MDFKVKKGEFYKTFNVSALNDENLSFKARGLLFTVLKFPNNWKGHVYHLSSITQKDGSYSVRSAIKELVENRYAKLKTERDSVSKAYLGKYYIFLDHKADENEYKDL